MITPEYAYRQVKAVSPFFRWAETFMPLGLSGEQAEKVGLYVQCYAQQMFSSGVLAAIRGVAAPDSETAEKIYNVARQALELCGAEIGIAMARRLPEVEA